MGGQIDKDSATITLKCGVANSLVELRIVCYAVINPIGRHPGEDRQFRWTIFGPAKYLSQRTRDMDD